MHPNPSLPSWAARHRGATGTTGNQYVPHLFLCWRNTCSLKAVWSRRSCPATPSGQGAYWLLLQVLQPPACPFPLRMLPRGRLFPRLSPRYLASPRALHEAGTSQGLRNECMHEDMKCSADPLTSPASKGNETEQGRGSPAGSANLPHPQPCGT